MDWSNVRMPGIDDNTVAVVLGAGGAIGGECCRALAAAGATTVVVTRDPDQGAKLAADLVGGAAVAATADLADTGSLERLVERLGEQGLAPSVLVNSAAIGAPRSDPATVPREQIRQIFEVNVVGAFEAIRTLSAPMRRLGRGRVVNVASVAAQRVLPGAGPYGSSKAALISLTQHLAVDLGPDGITVNSVSPGQTPTRLRDWTEQPGGEPQPMGSGSDTSGIPVGRRGRLEDYAGAVLFLCSSLADYITGVDIPVEGGARLVRAKSY